jgi:hypothetical protein
MKRRVVGCGDWLPRDRSGVLADQRHDGHRPNRCRIEQSQSAADLDGAYSPAMSRQDATPDQIATGHVIVIADVAIGIAPVTEAKAATTETTAAETAAMETATTVASTAMGEGSRAGSAEQDSRYADNAEAANGEQSYYRQPAPQDVVVARAVLSH